MKFGFKQKVLAAAVAIAVSSGANAAIQGTELAFFAANGSTNSVLFDLGLQMSQFGPGFSGTIVWDFDANGGAGNVTATTPGSTNVNYGNIWSGFSFNSGTKWGVIGADAVAGDLVSTSADSASTVGLTQNDPGFEASVDVPGVYFLANNQLGSHTSATNGASFATSANGSALHFNGFGASDQWRQKTPFSAAQVGAGEMSFYRLAYDLNGGGTSPMLLSTYAGTFSFNASNAQLTYQVAAIPEPSTYALLGAGLVMLGAIARRRINS